MFFSSFIENEIEGIKEIILLAKGRQLGVILIANKFIYLQNILHFHCTNKLPTLLYNNQ